MSPSPCATCPDTARAEHDWRTPLPGVALAVFDVDDTLLDGDSNRLWLRFLHARGLVDADILARHEVFLQEYAQGRLDFSRLLAFRRTIRQSLTDTQQKAVLAEFSQHSLEPAILPGARQLVAAYHALGVCVMVASATEEWLVRPVAQALGVAHLACTQDGDSVPCFGPHKLARVHALRAALAVRLRHTASLEPCVAYSDSLHDAPLLEAAEVAVAVDPEPGLASLAQRRGWPVVSFRNA